MNPEFPQIDPSPSVRPRGFLAAGRFLLPLGRWSEDDLSWRYAGRWLTTWGLLIGIVEIAVFAAAWRWLGEYQRVRLGPMAVLLVADLGWLSYRSVEGACRLVRAPAEARKEWTPAPAVLIALVVVLKFALLASLPVGVRVWPADWREHLSLLYPPVMYRPLLLMPLWGRWAMMLAMTIGRPAADAPASLRQMAGALGLKTVMAHWLACAGLTVFYCTTAAENAATGILISLAMMLVAYLFSFAIARIGQGQSSASVWAAGLVTELAFLCAYLPPSSSIYWY